MVTAMMLKPSRRAFAAGGVLLAFGAGAARAQTGQPDAMTIGSPNAPLHLVEFASMTCPHCAHFHESNWQTLKRNYIDAEQVFAHNEAQLKEASDAERARYGLYRASTLLSLGDAARAHEWLVSASRIARSDPDALSFEERRALSVAWRTHAALVARSAPDAEQTDSAPMVTAAQ